MINPDHISESLETIFWEKILKLFYAGPGFGMRIRDSGSGMKKKFGSRIQDKHPGSATLNFRYQVVREGVQID
jgi:hypothetical protein